MKPPARHAATAAQTRDSSREPSGCEQLSTGQGTGAARDRSRGTKRLVFRGQRRGLTAGEMLFRPSLAGAFIECQRGTCPSPDSGESQEASDATVRMILRERQAVCLDRQARRRRSGTGTHASAARIARWLPPRRKNSAISTGSDTAIRTREPSRAQSCCSIQSLRI